MSVAATLGTDVPGGSIQAEQKFYRAFGTLAFSGSYATGGDAVSFVGVVPIPKASSPVLVWITGIGGYTYEYVKSTGKVKVLQGAATASNPQAEIGATTYPAGVSSDVVQFEAVFPKV